MIHRILWRVGSPDSLDYWAARLGQAGVTTVRSSDEGASFYGIGPTGEGRHLLFQDPEGLTTRSSSRRTRMRR